MNIYYVPGEGSGSAPGSGFLITSGTRNVPPGHDLDALITDAQGTRRPLSVPPGLVQECFVTALRAMAGDLLPEAAAEVIRKTQDPFLQVIYDLEVSRMAYGRACLIGDAAFIARPHLGAGTAKAAENAWALADAIDAWPGDVETALRMWEPDELALGQAVVRRARSIGERFQSRASVIAEDYGYVSALQGDLRPPRRELATGASRQSLGPTE